MFEQIICHNPNKCAGLRRIDDQTMNFTETIRKNLNWMNTAFQTPSLPIQSGIFDIWVKPYIISSYIIFTIVLYIYIYVDNIHVTVHIYICTHTVCICIERSHISHSIYPPSSPYSITMIV